MNFRVLLTISILLLTGMESCKRETPPDIDPGAIIWKWEHEHKISASFLYQDKLILFIKGFGNEPSRVLALSQASGKLIWQSEELIFPGLSTYLLDITFDVNLFGNKLLVSGGIKTYAIDADNGKILWNDELENAIEESTTCLIEEYLYKASQTFEKSRLYRYNIHNGARELLLELTVQEHGGGIIVPAICLPVKWTDANGNELLIIPNSGFHPNNEDLYRLDIHAWNLTADSMEWQRKGVDIRASGRPVIEGNRVYFSCYKKVHCMDAATGNTLWSSAINIGYSIRSFMINLRNNWIIKDKFVVIGYEGILGFDKLTGKKIWSTKTGRDLLFAVSRVHNDTLWINNTSLLAVDGNTGEILIQWNNDITTFWNNSTTGQSTSGYIYTADRRNVYCLDPRWMK